MDERAAELVARLPRVTAFASALGIGESLRRTVILRDNEALRHHRQARSF
jgi:hypothetical protein